MAPLDIGLWSVAAFWLINVVGRLFDLRAVRELDPATTPADPPPRVSVVVTARDEEARIEQSVLRLLAQTGIDVEVVAVDDRSTDGTSAILKRLAAEHPALKVVRIDALPEDWLGKPHACQRGADRAGGDWLLFTDADAWMSPGLIARAVATAQREQAAMVCLFPGEAETTLAARAAFLNFATALLFFAARANRDRRRAAVGVGAFNLVRAEVYREIGGHASMRFEVIDDLKLGLLVARAGHRLRAFGAAHDLEVHWAGNVGGMIRALEKNAFALTGFNPALALAGVLAMSAVYFGALFGPFTGRMAGFAAGGSMLLLMLPAWRLTRRSGWGLPPVLLAPFLFPVIPVAVLNSTWTALRDGGVTWRGTFYPLELLRRRRVRL